MLEKLSAKVRDIVPAELEDRSWKEWSPFQLSLALGCTVGLIVLWAMTSINDD